MYGSFSFLNDQSKQPDGSNLFVRTYTNSDSVSATVLVNTPSDIEVKDMTLKENTPMIPPNHDGNPLLLWTSDYEIHYKGHLLVLS